MNNLVLVRVVAALNSAFAGAVLRDVRQDDSHRFRLVFDLGERGGSLLVSLRPEMPWIGRPAGPWPRTSRNKQAFAALCSRTLSGTLLTTVTKAGSDRVVHLEFSDGHALVAELATHGANLLLLGPRQEVLATARAPRRGRERHSIGQPYSAPLVPPRLLDPFAADGAAIDGLIDTHLASGESVSEVLRRRIFGLGTEAVELVLRERRGGERVGDIIVRRLADLSAGRADPIIEGPVDPDADHREPLRAAEDGTLDRGAFRLWPWPPVDPPPPGRLHISQVDAAHTAGLYHEALERLALVEQRWSALRTLVERELVRLASASANARADLGGFSDSDRHRRFGEALLAGLSQARVVDNVAWVPDPYAPDGSEIAVPIVPGTPLPRAATAHFERHRRAARGREQAARRVAFLDLRRRELAATLARYEHSTGFAALTALEQELRQQELPVALEPATRSGRAVHRVGRPRLEGVRVLTGRGGASILVGKGGPENDRLTFRLAAPEDLWFHAAGRPGAHVVVRDPGKGQRPAPEVVAEAAAVAAWYSDARQEGLVDVQWTRRKYVRRRPGAAPGAVTLKKFETVRVRPALPRSSS